MPGTKEIRSKIASVKSTQKITKAMQMVATSKMRRAQERMRMARPYAQKMRNVIGHLTEANPDYRHPFLVTREPRAVGIVVISTDRGLAGALNANVFKQTLLLMREWQGRTYEVVVLDDGFSWQGTQYRSLSAIARKITCTAWSGPLFFGLKQNWSAGHRSPQASLPGCGTMESSHAAG